LGIGIIGLFLVAAVSALMMWSGFSMDAFDIEIGGVTWATRDSAART
jgi:hypothetical protein